MEEIRVTIAEAAKMLDMHQMCLRIALRQGRFSYFGEAWKNDEKWSYYINKNRLDEYLGNKKGEKCEKIDSYNEE